MIKREVALDSGNNPRKPFRKRRRKAHKLRLYKTMVRAKHYAKAIGDAHGVVVEVYPHPYDPFAGFALGVQNISGRVAYVTTGPIKKAIQKECV